MDAARLTLLDDGPLVKLNVTSGKWCCILCKRQFPGEKQLGQHLTASDLHKTNVSAAEASGRMIRPLGPASAEENAPRAEGPASADSTADGVRKRAREHDAEQSLSNQRSRLSAAAGLHQMEEFDRALQGRAGASSSGGGGGKEPAYRDRAKERRETQGSATQSASLGGVRSARDINGNLDWRCGHCNKLNFARELACISCTREVDEDTEYAACPHLHSTRSTAYPDRVPRQVPRQLGLPEAAAPRDAEAGAAARAGIGWPTRGSRLLSRAVASPRHAAWSMVAVFTSDGLRASASVYDITTMFFFSWCFWFIFYISLL